MSKNKPIKAKKVNTDKDLDQFFTKTTIAQHCIDIAKEYLSTNESTLFIEPSAGSGSFSLLLGDNVLALDLEPQHTSIIKCDFLLFDINEHYKDKTIPTSDTIVVEGNPPFGKRGKLAKQFIDKAITFSDSIAMILPMNFIKWEMQNKIDSNYSLIYQEILDPNSFTFKNKDYSVRTAFQIWTKKETTYPNLRIQKKPDVTHPDFELFLYNNTPETLKFFDKNTYRWNFAVVRQGYNDYTKFITNENELLKTKQWIFFKTKTKKVLKRLQSIDYTKLSLKNTSTPGFGKADIIEAYTQKYGSSS